MRPCVMSEKVFLLNSIIILRIRLFQGENYQRNYIVTIQTSLLKNQNFRISRAWDIFETGQQIEALKIVVASKKIDEEIKKLAKTILAKEEKSETIKKDIEDEEFFCKVNNAVVYGGNTDFEYDNFPKQPKQKTEKLSTKYSRSQKVAKNAL